MKPRIENWMIAFDDRIVGQIYNHPSFPDGQVITTSRVAYLDEETGEVVTKNTEYLLGKRLERETDTGNG